MDNVEQVIADIRGRNVSLSVRDGKIIANPPLLPDEKEVLRKIANGRSRSSRRRPRHRQRPKHRSPPATARTTKKGTRRATSWASRHATEELASRAPVAASAAPAAPTHVTTVDEAMEAFGKWMGVHGEYWQWEPETLDALRAALVEGDKVHGLFAYTALIEHADGTRVEFQRKPNKKK